MQITNTHYPNNEHSSHFENDSLHHLWDTPDLRDPWSTKPHPFFTMATQ